MDRATSIILMVVFGTLGVVVLVLAWLQPISFAEKGLATVMGGVGLVVAASRIPSLKAAEEKMAQPLPVRTEIRK
jgi:hypothetical protein